MKNNNWIYINFEWIDWVGKTTQFELLSNELNAEKLSSHINNEIKSIRWYIERLGENSTDLRLSYFLMLSIHDSIIAWKLISEWKNIISDRNIFSTLAYHRALWSDIAKNISISNLNIKLPDLTIYLFSNEKERLRRINERGNLYSTDNYLENNLFFLEKVLDEYKKFDSFMVLIDTSYKSINDVFNEVKTQVNKYLINNI